MKPETSRTDQPVNEIDIALCRATLYSALALGFRPPTEETRSRLASKQAVAALKQAAALLDVRGGALLSAVEGLAAAEEESLESLQASHCRLFGHTAHGGVPPYETEYGAEALFQQPQELGDLTGFYRAFGLTLNPAEHERADHVSCECEFLSFLALKEAYALEQRDTSMLEETRKATRLFLRDHLGRFVPAFVKKLACEDRGGFYGALGDLCYRFITQECTRFSVPVGPENLTLRPATDDRVPMACGNGTDCPAMPGTCGPEEMEE